MLIITRQMITYLLQRILMTFDTLLAENVLTGVRSHLLSLLKLPSAAVTESFPGGCSNVYGGCYANLLGGGGSAAASQP